MKIHDLFFGGPLIKEEKRKNFPIQIFSEILENEQINWKKSGKKF